MPRHKITRCHECGCEFNPWDERYSWDYDKYTDYVCEDCFDKLFDELSRHERAMLIGSEITTAEEDAYDD